MLVYIDIYLFFNLALCVVPISQMALGAKARDTGRGTNAGKYIREGADSAIVTVVIWNIERPEENKMALDPERYGKVLIVRWEAIKTHGKDTCT